MTVFEWFEKEKIDIGFIYRKFDGKHWESYWKKANKFVIDHWNDKVDCLTDKQREWLRKILQDCVEKRIEG